MPEKKATKTKKRRGLLALGLFIRMVNLFFVVLLLVSYVAQFVSPNHFWILAFFGLGYPVFLVVNLIFVVFWLIRRRLFALVSILTILLGWQLLLAHVQLWGQKQPVNDARAIKVLTYNLKQLRGITDQTSAQVFEAIVTLIGKEHADVVVFQEFFSRTKIFDANIEKFKKATGLRYYTYRTYFAKGTPNRPVHCMVTLSRYPIVLSNEIMKGNRRVGMVTDLKVKGETIRLINVHFRSNYLNEQDLKLVDPDLAGIKSQESLKEGSKKIYWKLRKAFVDRALHADLVAEAIKQSPYPVIVAGDFNDTPASYTARTVLSGLVDSFEECGSGYGNTYAGRLPPIRIDYLAASDHFKVVNYYVIPQKLSDHYPVVATFIPAE